MKADIRFAPLARNDLQRVRAWHNQAGAGERAQARVQRILAAIKELAESPQRWPIGQHPGTRERIVERHVIVYRLRQEESSKDGTIIEIVRIFGPGQNRSHHAT